MFERRLKIFLAVLVLMTLVLLVRAGQVQVVEHEQWARAAAESMRRSHLVETVRGSILDRNGEVLAVDKPCVDVCVDYRAILTPPDEKWVLSKAEQRLKLRMGDEWDRLSRSKRKELAAAEAPAIKSDIQKMWVELARVSMKTPEQIEEARQAIINRVAMRQRIAWYRNYRRAMKQEEDRKEEAGWRRWLVEGIASDKLSPENYAMDVLEEKQAHVILRAIDVTLENYLRKHAERFPGLEIRASVHRTYPFATSAAQLMGRVSRVSREDLLAKTAPKGETREYLPNDEIGRGGIEALCELALRGTKGKVERVPGQDGETSRTDPVPGQDVPLTLDIVLQQWIESAFNRVEIYDGDGNAEVAEQLHGAVVVIDVASGEVLAMVSAPTYDLNSFEEMYTRLADDDLNAPLLNRATLAQLQPGSTLKPVVGLSAISAGRISSVDGIECTGYMMRPDRSKYRVGRCWVASKFENDPRVASVAHHPIPVPHPTGFLTFSDALERSCNIYFETMAERLGMEDLSDWYERFGLGRRTGVGVPEAAGRLPRSHTGPAHEKRYKTWFSGIGQDPVATNPLQMANAAATMARNGIWKRPRLISQADAQRLGIKLPDLKAATRGDAEQDDADPRPEVWPDEYDLHLDPSALAAMRDGMQRVVYGSAGTGKGVTRRAPLLDGIRLACKTGTAQAPKFVIKERDPQTGKVVLDEHGRPKRKVLEPSTPGNPNPLAPWYRGGDGRELNHSWYIGFAPAERPRIAFAVMVEYGGSGGGAAAAIARETLIGCVERNYLQGRAAPAGRTQKAARPAELLQDVSESVAGR